jgi:hypothetical protein
VAGDNWNCRYLSSGRMTSANSHSGQAPRELYKKTVATSCLIEGLTAL